MIPLRTVEKLKNPASCGERHRQILEIACSLSANGFVADAIFHQLRPKYGPDVPDNEIRNIIEWTERKFVRANKPCWLDSRRSYSGRTKYPTHERENSLAKTPLEYAETFLNGFSCSEADLFEASPVRLSENYRDDCLFVFEYLYFPQDKINIVTEFRAITGKEGSSKANPIGKGITKSRNNWLDDFRINSAPESDAGAWLRINSTIGTGISDDDISDFRFALLESDILPLDIQYSLLAKLPIPISAILTSGGKSLHAWIRISERSASEYREKVGKLFSLVSKFGFDSSNRNPSRLSRLPGVHRRIGAANGGIQKLIYLNPSPIQGRAIYE